MNPPIKWPILSAAWIPVLLATDYEGDRTAHRALVMLAVLFWSMVTDLTYAIDKELRREREEEEP